MDVKKTISIYNNYSRTENTRFKHTYAIYGALIHSGSTDTGHFQAIIR